MREAAHEDAGYQQWQSTSTARPSLPGLALGTQILPQSFRILGDSARLPLDSLVRVLSGPQNNICIIRASGVGHRCRARSWSFFYTCATGSFLPGRHAHITLSSGYLPPDQTGEAWLFQFLHHALDKATSTIDNRPSCRHDGRGFGGTRPGVMLSGSYCALIAVLVPRGSKA